MSILKVFIEELSAYKVYLRHGAEAQCVFVTFAAAFLIKVRYNCPQSLLLLTSARIKLLHPKYASYLKIEQRRDIQQSVKDLIDLLSSPEVVADDKHSPKLWSRFLAGLLATPMAKVELSPGALKGGSSLSRRTSKRSPRNTGSTVSQASTSANVGASPAASSQFADHLSPDTTMTTSPTSFQSQFSPLPPSLPMVAEEGQYALPRQSSANSTFDFNAGMQPMNGGQAGAAYQDSMNMNGNALQMNVPEFFQPPLPFDDLLQSMQSDPTIWQDVMPGERRPAQ